MKPAAGTYVLVTPAINSTIYYWRIGCFRDQYPEPEQCTGLVEAATTAPPPADEGGSLEAPPPGPTRGEPLIATKSEPQYLANAVQSRDTFWPSSLLSCTSAQTQPDPIPEPYEPGPFWRTRDRRGRSRGSTACFGGSFLKTGSAGRPVSTNQTAVPRDLFFRGGAAIWTSPAKDFPLYDVFARPGSTSEVYRPKNRNMLGHVSLVIFGQALRVDSVNCINGEKAVRVRGPLCPVLSLAYTLHLVQTPRILTCFCSFVRRYRRTYIKPPKCWQRWQLPPPVQ